MKLSDFTHVCIHVCMQVNIGNFVQRTLSQRTEQKVQTQSKGIDTLANLPN